MKRPRLRTTHTYAILDLSPEAYQEIRGKLVDAGYQHAIEGDDAGEVIDMHGIAVSEEEPKLETRPDHSDLSRVVRDPGSIEKGGPPPPGKAKPPPSPPPPRPPRVEDFPWGEFLEVRKRLVHWLRLYGNEGEPMDYEQIAQTVGCDVEQAKLIYATARDEKR